MSSDMEAEAKKRRCRANSDDTAGKGKSAIFYWSTAALFQFQTFFSSSSTALTQAASTTSEEYISCLCDHVSHCLALWTPVDVFLYIVYLPDSFLSCSSFSLCVLTCLSDFHIFYCELDDDDEVDTDALHHTVVKIAGNLFY